MVTMPIDDDRSVRLTSLAAEYELTPDGPWSGVLGAGWAVQRRAGEGTEDGLNLLAGARRNLGPATLVRGSVARQVRFPTLRDLYSLDRGNPELTAERTLSYELGLEHDFDAGRSHLELVLFRIYAHDFIQGLPGEPLSNTEEVRRQGVELSGRHRLGTQAHGSWSYTYLDASNRSAGADVATIQNQPRHKAGLSLDWDTPFGLRLRGDVLYVAGNFALSRTRPTRTLELDGYTVLGLSLSQALRGDRLRLVARVANLLDESYAESIGFPGPGRTVLLGLELRTGAHQVPAAGHLAP